MKVPVVMMFSALAAPVPKTRDGKLVVREDGLVRVPVFKMGNWTKFGQDVPITPTMLSQIRSNFTKAHWPVPLSYEHMVEHPEKAMGNPIPAAGKLREIEATADPDGNVYGWAEPTKRALQMLQDCELEHTSPAYTTHLPDITTGKDQGATLLSLALTNRPFLPTPAITMSVVLPAGDETDTNPAEAGTNPKEKTMFKKVKVSAITDGEKKGNLQIKHDDLPGDNGYYADADEVGDALGKASKVENSAEVTRVITLSGVAATELTPAVVEALATRVAQGATKPAVVELTAVPTKDGKRDYAAVAVPAGAVVSGDVFRAWQADVELDAAIAAGKILPAQRTEFARVAEKDVDLFRVMLSAMRPQVSLGTAGSGAAAGAVIELTAEDKSIAKQMGVSEESLRKQKARMAEAG